MSSTIYINSTPTTMGQYHHYAPQQQQQQQLQQPQQRQQQRNQYLTVPQSASYASSSSPSSSSPRTPTCTYYGGSSGIPSSSSTSVSYSQRQRQQQQVAQPVPEPRREAIHQVPQITSLNYTARVPSGPLLIDNSVLPDFSKLNFTNFEKVRLLGKGDVGKVYLVHVHGAPFNQQLFSMKILKKEEMIERNKIQRVVTENEILSTTKHPFIVTMYCSFQDEENLYLVMEYCSGGEFFNMLRRQPKGHLPESSVRFYAAEVLSALEYLHHIGVVYRDLKPENILVHESGHIRLTDFDLSKQCNTSRLDDQHRYAQQQLQQPQPVQQQLQQQRNEAPQQKRRHVHNFFNKFLRREKNNNNNNKQCASTAVNNNATPEPKKRIQQFNSFVGTAEYIAPEVITGFGYSSSVDWWTFGILLYEMLYGTTPFRGDDNENTFRNILNRRVNFPARKDDEPVSPLCQDLITQLLNPDPNQRLGSRIGAAEIKAHPWFAGVDWRQLPNKTPPIIPEVRDAFDFSNFADISDSEDSDSDLEEEHVEKIYSVDENLDELHKLMSHTPPKRSNNKKMPHSRSSSFGDNSKLFTNYSYRPSTPTIPSNENM